MTAPSSAAPALSPSNGLLLCIDMQPAFLAAIPESQRVHWRCSFALEAAAGLGLPVLFTEQVPGKLGGTAADLLALCKTPEALGKDAFSAFGDEKIADRLRAGGAPPRCWRTSPRPAAVCCRRRRFSTPDCRTPATPSSAATPPW